VCDQSPLGKSGNAQDLVRALGPHEWLGLFVSDLDERPNGALELAHAAVLAAICFVVSSATAFYEFSQEPYVGVKWTWNRGRLANRANERGLMGAVIVRDDMDVGSAGTPPRRSNAGSMDRWRRCVAAMTVPVCA
jgi:hypothetical protein